MELPRGPRRLKSAEWDGSRTGRSTRIKYQSDGSFENSRADTTMKTSELHYPVIMLPPPEIVSDFTISRDDLSLRTTTWLSIKSGIFRRSSIVDMTGNRYDIRDVAYKPNIFARMFHAILCPPIEVGFELSEVGEPMSPQEFGMRVRQVFQDRVIRENYEDVGFSVRAFERFLRHADSVGAIIQYILHNSGG